MMYDSEVVLTARVRPGSRCVELDFGKHVGEVCCSHGEARSFAATVRRLVRSYFGDTTTNTWNQPFRLKAERGNVVVFRPKRATGYRSIPMSFSASPRALSRPRTGERDAPRGHEKKARRGFPLRAEYSHRQGKGREFPPHSTGERA
jgi:hypothetical protein